MVIDSSAIIAVLLDEANAAHIARAIESGSQRLLSAATLLEASIVIESRKAKPVAASSICCSIAPPSRLLLSIRTRPRSLALPGGALARAAIRPG